MKDKKLQYRGFLIIGLVITSLLMGNITYTEAQGKSPTILSSIQNGVKEIKSLGSLQLNFRLVGTIIAGKENSFAVIMDETTGKQSMYKSGESINEASVIKIDKESIIVEKDGRVQVLRITGGSYTEAVASEVLTGDGPPSIGVSDGLPYFEPVFSKTGPPVDENVSVKELPHFEPVTNSAGPPEDPEGLYEDLPEFIPFESDSGPPRM